MSETQKPKGPVPGRLPAAGARRGGGPPWMNVGQPAEKSMTFGPSAKRLLRRLRPYQAQLLVIVALGVVSVTLSVIGPKILGRATDIIFAGLMGKDLPAGSTVQQAADRARASGNDDLANLIGAARRRPRHRHRLRRPPQRAVPGPGAVRRRQPAAVAAGLPAQRRRAAAVRELRAEVEDKLHRLPLPYFDGQPRGELLSRVTNDIDNIAQTLQQTLSQLLTSLLTVVGVLVMMFVISPLLAVIALVAVPLSVLRHPADREALAEAVRRPVAAHRRAQRRTSRRRSRATSW